MPLYGIVLALGLVLAACAPEEPAEPAAEEDVEDDDDIAEVEEEEDAPEEVPRPDVGALRIATQDEGSGWHAYGATISELVREELGVSLQVLPVGGAVANNSLVQEGDAELGLLFNNIARWGYEGRVAFEAEHDDLRALVGGMDQYYLGVVARADLDADSIDDVAENEMGINLYTVPLGGGGELTTGVMLDLYGFDYGDIESWGGSVEHTSFDVIQSAFRDGRADIMSHVITEGHPALTEIAQTTDIKLLPVDRDDVVETLVEDYGMEQVTLQGGSFRGQDEDLSTVGLVSVLGASADVPDDVAYWITKVILENRDTLVGAHPSLAPLDPQTAADPALLGIPLHPGAERYYEEEGLLHE